MKCHRGDEISIIHPHSGDFHVSVCVGVAFLHSMAAAHGKQKGRVSKTNLITNLWRVPFSRAESRRVCLPSGNFNSHHWFFFSPRSFLPHEGSRLQGCSNGQPQAQTVWASKTEKKNAYDMCHPYICQHSCCAPLKHKFPSAVFVSPICFVVGRRQGTFQTTGCWEG